MKTVEDWIDSLPLDEQACLLLLVAAAKGQVLPEAAILLKGEVVPCHVLVAAHRAGREPESARVAFDEVGQATVSTIFSPVRLPGGAWFETLATGPEGELCQRRYATWAEAERGHAEVVRWLRAGGKGSLEEYVHPLVGKRVRSDALEGVVTRVVNLPSVWGTREVAFFADDLAGEVACPVRDCTVIKEGE